MKQIYAQVEALLAEMPVRESLWLAFLDCPVRVRTNDGALRDALREYYVEFVAPEADAEAVSIDVVALQGDPGPLAGIPCAVVHPEAPKRRVKDEHADFADGRLLRKQRTGMHFVFGGAVQVAIGDCRSNLNQVVNFINNRFIQRALERGGLLCHAAGVAHNGEGIAICGMSGRGKSTVALEALDRGMNFLSNDRLVLQPAPGGRARLLGIPKHPRVNPGTILSQPALGELLGEGERRRLAELAPDALWSLEEKYDALIWRHFGRGRFELEADLCAVVVLNWQRTSPADTEVREVDLSARRDLLDALVKTPGVHYYDPTGELPAQTSCERYVEVLRGTPVIELTGGVNFRAAVHAACNYLTVCDVTESSPGGD